ncbi:hypothetical protein B0H12DRAFT_1201218 [Mycena haematopus]|nr:hypothetical protein B0H12DRAFT_1201218 [Mycena haematopus]
MVTDVPLVPVNLATVALESFFYGAFVVLSLTSISLLITRNGRVNRSGQGEPSILVSPIFCGAVALFITITSHWILTVDRAFLAFIHFEDGTFPLGFYADLSQATEVVKTGFLLATVIIGDMLIIHRLWIVWGHNNYIIIFPICTLIGLSVCSVGITYQFTQYKPGQNVFLSEAGRWITSDTVFTLCTNLYSTSLISWYIWKNSRVIQPYGAPNLKAVLGIVIEMTARFQILGNFFFAAYQSQSNLQFIIVDCLASVTGISCMLIHVRVGLGWAQQGSQTGFSAPSASHQHFAVNITRVVDTNDDYRLAELRSEGNKADVV